MKKLFLFLFIFALWVSAYTLNIKPGWQLLGTGNNEINASLFNNSNIISVWTFDDINKKWKVYLPNKFIDLNKYGIEPLTKIGIFKGYWVQSISSFSIDINTSYPLVEKIGNLWGVDWYKTKAFYKGDTRYLGNDVILNQKNGYLLLRAYKKYNQDSRAQAITKLSNTKGFSANINLVTDNKYSFFQVMALAKNINTSENIGNLDKNENLNFLAGINISKNKIVYWYEITESMNKYFDKTVGSQIYNYDLTNLTNNSDVKVNIEKNGDKIIYRVYNLADNSIIFNKSLDINSTKINNFNNFNLALFRSRVRDDKANQNKEEAIEKSENIINGFNVSF